VCREDVPELAQHFLQLAARANDRPGARITDAAISALSAHSWPGNVRELRNIIERLVILSPDDTIDADDVAACLGASASGAACGLFRAGVPFRVLSEEAERTILQEALVHYGGQMAATARALDLERSHFYKKCKALGLRGSEKDGEPSD
jgi:DNA-binding NtrC family response regulator